MYSDRFRFPSLSGLGRRRPAAYAEIMGGMKYPDIRGLVRFYNTPPGVLVTADIEGLPVSDERCEQPVFAFHIHEGGSCAADGTSGEPFSAGEPFSDREPFPETGGHYNPFGCPHPYHAGDMPPLFGVRGNAFSVFLTGRFAVRDIIGRTVIIHEGPDDFHTQPSGNSGAKIACGVIRATRG